MKKIEGIMKKVRGRKARQRKEDRMIERKMEKEKDKRKMKEERRR